MTDKTRSVRLQQIKEDDKDPTDTVVVSTSASAHGQSYHDPEADCPHVKEITETREVTREDAQKRILAPCETCILETATTDGGSRELYESLKNTNVTSLSDVGDLDVE